MKNNFRSEILLIIILFYLITLIFRLPDWNSDGSIWLAAVETDIDDPWVLSNVAAALHDKRAFPALSHIIDLQTPQWFPLIERTPYYMGLRNLAGVLEANDDKNDADIVERLANMQRRPVLLPPVTFVTDEKNNAPK